MRQGIFFNNNDMERCMKELENKPSRKELGSATAKGGFFCICLEEGRGT
jgi:succinate dehydrogenase/fumarate reductase flavoprotein subunit